MESALCFLRPSVFQPSQLRNRWTETAVNCLEACRFSHRRGGIV